MQPVMTKNVTVKVYNTTQVVKELTLTTHDGKPDVIKADKNVNYEFFDHSIGHAPNHIITKRLGNDLHVSFEREGEQDDLIVEGFFDSEHHDLVGLAENGNYYYYIPDTGEVADYVTQLQDLDVEGQALGGEPIASPLWIDLPQGFPWWLGMGIVPFLFGKDKHKDKDPIPEQPQGETVPNSKMGELGKPVTQKPADNDKNVDPKTLKIIDPITNKIAENNSVVVKGQGTWTLNPNTAEVTFTPDADFKSNPTPINYTIKDNNGKQMPPTPLAVEYSAITSADIKPANVGEPVTQKVTSNDGNVDASTVKLIDPTTGKPTNNISVKGQGTWTLKPGTDEVTFTPEKGFTGDPTPISYIVTGKNGSVQNLTPIAVEYPSVLTPDSTVGKSGQPITQNVTDNDGGDVDPNTVQLIDPKNPTSPPSKTVVIPNEGTWTAGPNPGEVTFTPNSNFSGDPTPIQYVAKDKNGNGVPPTSVDVVVLKPFTNVTTNPDSKVSKPGQPITQNVTSNDGGDVDPNTVQLIDPKNPTSPPSKTVVIPNEGTWTAGPNPGEVTFTPNSNFSGDPTPIQYVAKDKNGNGVPPTSVDVAIVPNFLITAPDTKPSQIGQPVTQNVTDNDNNANPATVRLIDPNNPGTADKPIATNIVKVPNQGTWTVESGTDKVTFTPEKGFTGNPNPINYIVDSKDGVTSQPTPINATYPKILPEPIVAITGLSDVNEAVGKVDYTISLMHNDGRPYTATEDTQITYSVKQGNSKNPAESQDLTDGFVTKTITINKGQTKVTIKVGVVNDKVFEGFEDYIVSIDDVKGGGANGSNASISPIKNQVVTTILDNGNGTTDGRDPHDPTNNDPNKPGFDPTKPVGPNNDPRKQVPNQPAVDDDRDTATVAIKAVDNTAIEKPTGNTADTDNKLVYALSLTDAQDKTGGTVTVKVMLDPQSVADASDIASIQLGDETLNTPAQIQDFLTNGKELQVSKDKPTLMTVTAKDDSLVENSEALVFKLDKPADETALKGATIDPQVATGNIIDEPYTGTPNEPTPTDRPAVPTNDKPMVPTDPTKPFDPSEPNTNPLKPVDPNNTDGDKPIVGLSGLGEVNEAVGKVSYTVSLDRPASQDIVVQYVVKPHGDKPASQADFADTTTLGDIKQLTIKQGQNKAVIDIDITNDSVFEGSESYSVNLVHADNKAIIADKANQVVTTILDNGTGTTNGRDPFDPTNNDPNKPGFDPTKPVGPNNDPRKQVPNQPAVDDDRDTATVAIKAVDNTAIEKPTGNTADTDNKLVYALSLTDAQDKTGGTVTVKVVLDPQSVADASDIASIQLGDETLTPEQIKDFLTNGKELQVSKDKPTLMTVTAKDDSLVENSEALVFKLDKPADETALKGATIDPQVATGTIIDEPYTGTPNEPTPTDRPAVPTNDKPMVPTDPTKPFDPSEPNTNPLKPVDPNNTDGDKPIVGLSGLGEVNEAVGKVSYTVSLDRPASQDIVVQYVVKPHGDKPASQADFADTTTLGDIKQLTIKQGQNKAVIDIDITNDSVFEGSESYSVNLVHADNKAIIADKANQVVTTILDNGTGTTNGRDPFDPTNNDPNKPGFDPTKPVGPNNDPRKQVPNQPAVDDDRDTATVAIKAVDNTAIEKPTGNTADTDNKLVYALSLTDAQDKTGGTVTVKVVLDPQSVADASDIASIQLGDETLTPEQIKDFLTNGKELQVSKDKPTLMTVTAKDDSLVENSEALVFKLDKPADETALKGATIDPQVATGTIIDEPYTGTPNEPTPTDRPSVPTNDKPMVPTDPTKPFDPSEPNTNPLKPVDPNNTDGDKPIVGLSGLGEVNEAVGKVSYTVSLDRPASQDIVVQYVVKPHGDKPASQADFADTTTLGDIKQLTIKQGQNKAVIDIDITNDSVFEGSESYSVNLVHADNKAIIADKANQVVTTILDNGTGTTNGRDPFDPTNNDPNKPGFDPTKPVGPNNDPRKQVPNQPAVDDDRDTATVAIKAVDNTAIEKPTGNTADTDNKLVYALSLTDAQDKTGGTVTVKVVLDPQSVADASDIASIQLGDETLTPEQIKDFLTNGKELQVSKDKPTLMTVTAKDDSLVENSEALVFKLDKPADETALKGATIDPQVATGNIIDEPYTGTPNEPTPTDRPSVPTNDKPMVPTDPTKPFDPSEPNTNPLKPVDPNNTDGDKPIVGLSGLGEVNEAVGKVSYTVSLDRPASQDIVVQYVVKPHGDKPASQADFADTTTLGDIKQLTIKQGQNKAVIDIDITNDSVFEGSESYSVNLVHADNKAIIADKANQVVTTILDNGTGTTNGRDPFDPTNNEPNKPGFDPTKPVGPNNDPRKQVPNQPAVDDDRDTATVAIKAVDNTAIEKPTGNTADTDNKLVYALSLTDAQDKTGGTVTVKVVLDPQSVADASDIASIQLGDETLTPEQIKDFLTNGKELQVSKDKPTLMTVTAKDDSLVENSEALVFKLDKPADETALKGATIDPQVATGTIIDEPYTGTPNEPTPTDRPSVPTNDKPMVPTDPTKPFDPSEPNTNPLKPVDPNNTDGDKPIVGLSGLGEVNEAVGKVSYTVSLDRPASQDIVVQYVVKPHGDKPASQADFADTTTLGDIKQLTIKQGQNKAVIDIDITNDSVFEGSESYSVNLVHADNKAIIADKANQVVTTILDNGTGTTNGRDPFDPTNNEPNKPGFDPTKPVGPNNDPRKQVPNQPAVDDDRPTLSIQDTQSAENNKDGAIFDLTLDKVATTPITLNLALEEGTAKLNSDYKPALKVSMDNGQSWQDVDNNQIVIPANTQAVKILVPLVDDSILEPDERFVLTATEVGSVMKTPTAKATATIIDDDKSPTITNPNAKDVAGEKVAGSVEEATGDKAPLTGTVTITNPQGVKSLTIQDQDITTATTDKPVEIKGTEGTLKVTGYNKDTGVISYTYVEDGKPNAHIGDKQFIDNFAIKLVDQKDKEVTEPLKIAITDTAPNAQNDIDIVGKPNNAANTPVSATGNVIEGTSNNNANGVKADSKGADTPVNLVKIGKQGANAQDVGETVEVEGTYGKLSINKDGSYTYTLDTNKDATKQLVTGKQSEVFEYTIKDADGDESKATLTIEVAGAAEPVTPTFNVSNTQVTEGDNVYAEFTVTVQGDRKQQTTFNLGNEENTAKLTTDYTAQYEVQQADGTWQKADTFTAPAGKDTATIKVRMPIVNDAIPEPNEQFKLVVTTQSDEFVAKEQKGTATIIDDNDTSTITNPNAKDVAGEKVAGSVEEATGDKAPLTGTVTITNPQGVKSLTIQDQDITTATTDKPVEIKGTEGTLKVTGYNKDTGVISYTYVEDGKPNAHIGDKQFIDNFAIKLVDQKDKEVTEPLKIAITDTAPNAQNDIDIVGKPNNAANTPVSATGNVIEGTSNNNANGVKADSKGADTPVNLVKIGKQGANAQDVGETVEVEGTYGKLSINKDGSYTYTLDTNKDATKQLVTGKQSEVFEYTIKDADGDESKATLTIEVAGAAEPVTPTFNVSNTQVTEGDNVYAEFTVTVQGDRKQQTTFNLGNEENTAKLTTDYTAQYEVQQADGTWQKADTFTAPAGKDTATIKVRMPIVNDAIPEPNEQFKLVVTTQSDEFVAKEQKGTATIIDDNDTSTITNPNAKDVAGEKVAGSVEEATGDKAPLTGTVTITNPQGVKSLTIQDQDITTATTDKPVEIKGTEGTLKVTGYNKDTGVISYTYVEDGKPNAHIGDKQFIDNFAIKLVDQKDKEVTEPLKIAITDTAPNAQNDIDIVGKPNNAANTPVSATGNVIEGTSNNNANGVKADSKGADTPVNLVKIGKQGANAQDVGETVEVEGTYGKLSINKDGSYTYTLDTNKDATKQLVTGKQSEVFEYTIKDADGDESKATLTIEVAGAAEPVTPTFNVSNTQVTEGDNVYAEFTVTVQGDRKQQTTFNLGNEENTAKLTTDYTAQYEVQQADGTWQKADTFTAPAGKDTATIKVRMPIVNDAIPEPNEQFKLVVTTQSDEFVAKEQKGTATIIDDNDTSTITNPNAKDVAGEKVAGSVEEATGDKAPLTGTVTITNPQGVKSLTIQDQDITTATTDKPVEIKGTEGTLKVTGYNKDTGVISYTYVEDGKPNAHIGDKQFIDNFAIKLVDQKDKEVTEPLKIAITDTAPNAQNDIDIVGKPNNAANTPVSATGNVIEGTSNNNANGVKADSKGADTPVNLVKIGKQGANAQDVGETVEVEGTYGKLSINKDGSYTYTLDTNKDATKQLVTGKQSEVFEYTIKDADGDESKATLTIEVAGAAEPVTPTFNVSNTQVTEGDNVYAEFTVTVQGDRKQQTTFNLGNEENTAKLTTDYTAQYEVQQADGTWQKADTFTAPAGKDTATIKVRMPIVNDAIPEPNEQFKLVVTTQSDEFVAKEQKGTATIIDDNDTSTITNPNAKDVAGEKVAGSVEEATGDKAPLTGTVTITNPQGVKSLTIQDQDITTATTDKPVEIKGTEGTLKVTGYNKDTGVISYTYVEDGKPNAHIGDKQFIDNFAIKLVDQKDKEVTEPLKIAITDTAPNAQNDIDIVGKPNNAANTPVSATGNVIEGTSNNNANGVKADSKGADTPVNLVKIGKQGANAQDVGETVEVEGTYGKLSINKDGSYTYTLDTNKDATKQLVTGKQSEVFEYTIKDADGDESKATLTIEVAGAAEPVTPTFNVSNTQVTEGDNVYAEFTVTVQGDRKQQTTFNLGNEENTAKLTTDYTAQYEVQQADGTWQKADTFTAPAGKDTATIKVRMPIVNDAIPEPNEQFKLVVTTQSDEFVAKEQKGTATIIDDNDTSTITNPNAKDVAGEKVAGSVEEATGDKAPLTGTVTITNPQGVKSLTIQDQDITTATTDKPVEIKGTEGTLKVTGYNKDTGVISYTYVEDGKPNAHIGDKQFIDNFAIKLVDQKDKEVTEPLKIAITDTAPNAQNDIDIVGKPNNAANTPVSATGNVIEGTSNNNANGVKADSKGADTPVNLVKIGKQGANAQDVGETVEVEGTYGKLSINKDGSYTYTLDTNKDATKQLVTGKQSEVFEYTIKDADGDESKATLTIEVAGAAEPILTQINAQPDTETVTEDTKPRIAGNLVTNDTITPNPKSELKITSITPTTANTPEQAMVKAVETIQGKYGTLNIRSNGQYDYTLNNKNPDVNALNTGEKLEEVFTYKLQGGGQTDNTTFTITINGTDDKASIEAQPPAKVSENKLSGGNDKDSTADEVVEDKSGKFIITDADNDLNGVNMSLDTPETKITVNGGTPTTWVGFDAQGMQTADTKSIVKWQAQYTNNKGIQFNVLTLELDKNPNVINKGQVEYGYTATLHHAIDHTTTQGDQAEGWFDVKVRTHIYKNGVEIATAQNNALLVTQVKDDKPEAIKATHNIDVPRDTVVINDIRTGFKRMDDVVLNKESGLDVTGSITRIDEFDKDGSDSRQNDVKPFGSIEELNWETSYVLSDNDRTLSTNALDKQISLGSFTHNNRAASGILFQGAMDVGFNVDINGISQKVHKEVDIYHIETLNSDLTKSTVLGSPDVIMQDWPEDKQQREEKTADDFVVMNLKQDTYLLDGKRYRLSMGIDQNETESIKQSQANFEFMKKVVPNQENLGYQTNDQWESRFKPNMDRQIKLVNYLTTVNDTGKTAVEEGDVDKPLDINNDGFVDAIERGELLVIRTTEPSRGGEIATTKNLYAKLVPLDEPIQVDNNIEISGKLKKGADQPGKVLWTTTDSDVTNPNVSQDNKGNKVFKTKYGTFTANQDGTYDFKAGVYDLATKQTLSLAEILKDLPQAVGNSTENDRKLTFGYEYIDNDGDKATNIVEINLKDYMQSGTATNKQGGDDNDAMKGTSKAGDVLRGGNGDDLLEGLAGKDQLFGEAGDDYFIPSFVTDTASNTLEDIIDGGAGHDAILLYSQYYVDKGKLGAVLTNDTFDTTTFATNVDNIEEFSLRADGAQTLTVKASDVLNMTDQTNSLFITGTNEDSVKLEGDFVKVDKPYEYRGETFTAYNATVNGTETVVVYVDTDIKII